MPNTLAHLGVGGLISRAVLPDVDTKWIYLGCIIPDTPWILQRIVKTLPLTLDPYELRTYAIGQASLASCALLSAAFALLSAAPRKVFLALVLNSAIHLLLDACQTKWANGVHLFAPISWNSLNFSLFWPESLVTTSLTVFGAAYVVYMWFHDRSPRIGLAIANRGRWVAAALLFSCYAALPLAFTEAVQGADSHYVETLRDTPTRTGKRVEFDRNRYISGPQHGTLITFAGERLLVTGSLPSKSATASVKAVFSDVDTIRCNQIHLHRQGIRESASVLGLLVVGLVWCHALIPSRWLNHQTHTDDI